MGFSNFNLQFLRLLLFKVLQFRVIKNEVNIACRVRLNYKQKEKRKIFHCEEI